MTLLTALAGDAETEALLGDEAQLDAMLAVEKALADASADVGWIETAAAAAIGAAIAGFVPDRADLAAGMAQDGVVVPALLRQLRATIAPPHRDALHRGATSQDIVDTALMLQLRRVLDLHEARLDGLLGRLARLAATDGGRPLLGHTRMQVAVPTTWGAKLASWSDPLSRGLGAIRAMRPTLLVVQLGGPVGDRGSFAGYGDAIAARIAARLGLGTASPWQATRDPIVGLGNVLALLSGTLGKLGADVGLLAQNEIAAVRLTGGGTSSAMAHKSNPVNAEVLVALARFNAGLAGTLHQAMVHENERSGAAWTLEWLVLPLMLVTTGAGLSRATTLLDQLQLA